MSLFGKIFNNNDNSVNKDSSSFKIEWKSLTELNDLDTVIESSFKKPVFIFKHSTRCGISRMVLKQFEKLYDIEKEKAEGYYLDLLEYRSISNEVASRFDITHQSPQLILIKNGKAVYDASHQDIEAETLKKEIEKTPL